MKTKLIITIILANLVLAASQLAITTIRSTDGPELASYYAKIDAIKLDNWRLQQDISDKSSLSYLELHADSLNLTKVKPTFVKASNNVASLTTR